MVQLRLLTTLIVMMFSAFPAYADYSSSHTVSSLLDIGLGMVHGKEPVVISPLWKTLRKFLEVGYIKLDYMIRYVALWIASC
jgi:hypothetical protein